MPNVGLSDLYEKFGICEPKRARGGRWALAGFEYQFLYYLTCLVERLIKRRPEEPPEDLQFELLADQSVWTDEDGLCLYQVKRTLSAASLRDAVAEAAAIVRFLRDEAPEYLDSLSFRIVTSNEYAVTPERIESALDAAIDPEDDELRQLVAKALTRKGPVRFDEDARAGLYAVLWKAGIRDRGAFIDGSLGKLLAACSSSAAGGTTDPIAQAAREISDFFSRCKDNKADKVPGTLWTVDRFRCVPDEAVAERKVLFDSVPRPEHLATGQVMARTVLDDLWKAFQHWEASDPGWYSLGKIRTFWIAGRPGDGKSVLLLQLAQRLLERNPRAAVFSVPSSGVVTFLTALKDVDWGSTPIYLVVDDLHREMLGTPSLVSDLASLLDQSLGSLRILACGPTSQFGRFADTFTGSFEVKSFVVPQPTKQEAVALGTWLTDRTGRQTNADRIVTANKLLVELVFELRFGETLAQFAESRRQEYSKLPGFSLVLQSLALSALGLSTPPDWFDDEGWEVYERLQADDLVRESIENVDEEEIAGLRLFVHPTFAERVFKRWLVSSNAERSPVGTALGKAAAYWERKGHWKLASRYLLHLPTSSAVRSLVPSERMKWVVPEAYRAVQDAGIVLTASPTLYHWLRCLANGPVELSPDPVDIALKALGSEPLPPSVNGPLLSSLWLLGDVRRYQDRLQPAREMVARLDLANPEIYGIAPFLGTLARRSDDPIATGIVRALVDGKPEHPKHRGFLHAVIPHSHHHPWVIDYALAWALEPRNADAAGSVLMSLVSEADSDSRVLDSALTWALDARHSDRSGQVYWALVVRAGDRPEIIDAALAWATDELNFAKAGHVLRALAGRASDRPEIIDAALAWATDKQNLESAGHVLESLVANAGDRHEIIDAALNWATDKQNGERASNIMEALVANASDRPEIIDAALAWATHELNFARAGEVFGVLVGRAGHRAEIIDAALAWATAKQNSESAGNVLEALVANAGDRPEIIDAALAWATDGRNAKRAKNVLGTLVGRAGDRPEIIDAALAWATAKENSESAGYIFEALVANASDHPEIIDAALAWATDGRNAERAKNVLGTLVGRAGDRPEIIDAALAWATDPSNEPKSGEVIRALLANAGDRDEVISLALKAIDLCADGSYEILIPAMRWAAKFERFHGLGLQWMEAHPHHSQNFRLVASALVHAPIKEPWINHAEAIVARKPQNWHTLLIPLATARGWPSDSVSELQNKLHLLEEQEIGYVIAKMNDVLIANPCQFYQAATNLVNSSRRDGDAQLAWLLRMVSGRVSRKEMGAAWISNFEEFMSKTAPQHSARVVTAILQLLDSGSHRAIKEPILRLLVTHPEATLLSLNELGKTRRTRALRNKTVGWIAETLAEERDAIPAFLAIALRRTPDLLPTFLRPLLPLPDSVVGIDAVVAVWLLKERGPDVRTRFLRNLAAHPDRVAKVRTLVCRAVEHGHSPREASALRSELDRLSNPPTDRQT